MADVDRHARTRGPTALLTGAPSAGVPLRRAADVPAVLRRRLPAVGAGGGGLVLSRLRPHAGRTAALAVAAVPVLAVGQPALLDARSRPSATAHSTRTTGRRGAGRPRLARLAERPAALAAAARRGAAGAGGLARRLAGCQVSLCRARAVAPGDAPAARGGRGAGGAGAGGSDAARGAAQG